MLKSRYVYIEWDNCPRCGAKTIKEEFITKCSKCDWIYELKSER